MRLQRLQRKLKKESKSEPGYMMHVRKREEYAYEEIDWYVMCQSYVYLYSCLKSTDGQIRQGAAQRQK